MRAKATSTRPKAKTPRNRPTTQVRFIAVVYPTVAFTVAIAANTMARPVASKIIRQGPVPELASAPNCGQPRALAQRVVEHLELSGFEIDENEQVLRKRPPSANHG
jgi:hypothetical protein